MSLLYVSVQSCNFAQSQWRFLPQFDKQLNIKKCFYSPGLKPLYSPLLNVLTLKLYCDSYCNYMGSKLQAWLLHLASTFRFRRNHENTDVDVLFSHSLVQYMFPARWICTWAYCRPFWILVCKMDASVVWAVSIETHVVIHRNMEIVSLRVMSHLEAHYVHKCDKFEPGF